MANYAKLKGNFWIAEKKAPFAKKKNKAYTSAAMN